MLGYFLFEGKHEVMARDPDEDKSPDPKFRKT